MAWVLLPNVVGFKDVVFLSVGTVNNQPRVELLSNGTGGVWRVRARRLDADSTLTLDGLVALSTNLTHVAAVATYSAQAFELYVDGQLDSSANPVTWVGSTSATDSVESTLGIRGGGSAGSDARQYDSRVYSRALSAVEINDIFLARGRDGNFFGLQSRYKCIEGAPGAAAAGAGVIKDDARQALNGTPSNDPVFREYLVGGTRRRHRG